MKRPEKSIINPVNNYYRCVKLIILNAQWLKSLFNSPTPLCILSLPYIIENVFYGQYWSNRNVLKLWFFLIMSFQLSAEVLGLEAQLYGTQKGKTINLK